MYPKARLVERVDGSKLFQSLLFMAKELELQSVGSGELMRGFRKGNANYLCFRRK